MGQPFSMALALTTTPAILLGIGKIWGNRPSSPPSDDVLQCPTPTTRASKKSNLKTSQIHRATEAVHRYMVET